MQIREQGAAGYCCDVVLCIDQSSGLILKQAVLKPEDSDAAVAAAAHETLDSLRQRAPGVGVVWVARQERVATALAARFRRSDIALESGDSFGPWDEAYLAMDRQMGSGGGMLPYLWRGDIMAEEVAELFAAAARFYQMRPWQFITDAELLEMPNPDPGQPPLFVSVMGASGISRGLALFDTEADFEQMASDRGRKNVAYASFEGVNEVPHTVTSEAEEHGWVLASTSAFPMVLRVREGKPVPCSGDDLRRVTAAFRVLVFCTGNTFT